jgi:DNA-directed RNA polymerase beta subunit
MFSLCCASDLSSVYIVFTEYLELIMTFVLNLQRDGMTIHAERLNFHRYISHFRSVHRGSAFAKMRTTSVRKLLPEYVILLLPF